MGIPTQLSAVRARAQRLVLAGLLFLVAARLTAQPAGGYVPVPGNANTDNAHVLYVSPAGDDAWSGQRATPNAAGTDGPLAALSGARDRVRALKGDDGVLDKEVVVFLRDGVYPLSEPVVFTPADSGSETCPITYRAYPEETPIFSGGVPVTEWRPDTSEQSRLKCDGKLWRAPLPDAFGDRLWRFNQLYINGHRRTRARSPNRGAFLRTDGPTGSKTTREFYFTPGDVAEWEDLRQALFVVYHSWETSLHHVRSVDADANIVTFREPAPWPMGRWEKRQRYYVEGIFEALDEPGEWCLDPAEKVVYYYPYPGETPDTVTAIAPLVGSTLVSLAGSPAEGKTIDYLRFRGIAFRHTDANLRRLRNPGQGEIYQPALIMAVGLRHSIIDSCEVAQTGAHAIWLAAGCSGNLIQRCHLHDLGGGGVYIGGGWGIQDATPAGQNTVDNCFIHDGGHLFHGAHGVWIGKSSHNTVTHNEISNFDYTGISCGWSWGFQPSSANHNILDYNHIHHLSNGDGLSDMGGIYTLGVSPGTTERFNHIHHVYNYAHVSHGSGLYPDEGSSEILMENNVVHRVRNSPLFMHYGADCTVRNNVLAFGDKGQLRRSREDKRCHYNAVGNIVYGAHERMLDGPWKNGDWHVERNLYWSTAGEPDFAGRTFAQWQAEGNDGGARVADPLFVDPESGDFSLNPGSPAREIGFNPIDLSRTGLHGDREWTTLPGRYPNRERNEIAPPEVVPIIINYPFEALKPGAVPFDGKVVTSGGMAAATVSDEAAADGAHSLRFRDAHDLPHSWMPHIYYHRTYTDGKIHISWDMMNTREAPASFYVEVREYPGGPYLVGPTVSVSGNGTVTASDQFLSIVPLGKWVHVAIDLTLAENAPQTYRIALTVPGRDPVIRELPYRNDTFRRITWLGISSTSESETVFHIDNLRMGTAEDLAQPLRRRRRSERRKREPRPPANTESLMGHWRFDGAEGYTALDSSGYANDGDVWGNWARGAFGTAVFLDPAAQYVLVPDDPTLQLGTGDFSIELWICPTDLSINSKDARRRFLSKDDFPKTWWNMNITTAGHATLEMTDTDGNRFGAQSSGTIPENAWTHLALTVSRTAREARFYVNGQLDSTTPVPEAFTGSMDVKGGEFYIGSNWQPIIGLIDELRVYKRVLAPDAIEARWDAQKSLRAETAFEILE